MLHHPNVAGFEDVDDRVDVAPWIDRPVAGHHQTRPNVVGDRRREAAKLIAINDSVGDAGTELDHRLERLEMMFGLGDIVVRHQQLPAEADRDPLGCEAFQDGGAVVVEPRQGGTTRLVSRGRAIAGEGQQPRGHLRYRFGKDS